MPHTWDPSAITPHDAYERLVAGNARFLASESQRTIWSPDQAARDQRPFAIVLGCSDSRTPVEIVFDQGFGDLFVVRIAGNIAAPSVVGSVEFAASQFGSRLVVVLGHTQCGAVAATVDAIASGQGPASKNIRSITDRIVPHIEGLVQPPFRDADERLGVIRESIRANIAASADHLRHGSRLIEDLVLAGRIVVVTAEYDLETGKVHFFGELPAPDALT
jgi:carbonic anhydrase